MSSTTTKPYHLKQFGAWTEQQSSAGKRYFYNRETEVSQWEKPPEWREQERLLRHALRNKKGGTKPTTTSSATDVYGSAIPNDPINANLNTTTLSNDKSCNVSASQPDTSQKSTSSSIVTMVPSSSITISSKSQFHPLPTTPFTPQNQSSNLSFVMGQNRSGGVKRAREENESLPSPFGENSTTDNNNSCEAHLNSGNNSQQSTPRNNNLFLTGIKQQKIENNGINQKSTNCQTTPNNRNATNVPIFLTPKNTHNGNALNPPFQKAFGYKTPQQLYDDMSAERASLKAVETHQSPASTSQESSAIKINPSTFSNNNVVTKNFQQTQKTPLNLEKSSTLNNNLKKEETPTFNTAASSNTSKPQQPVSTPIILPLQHQRLTPTSQMLSKKANFGQTPLNMPKPPKNNSVWVFREERYMKFYRADLTHHRRSLNNDTLKNEIKKYADRSAKQSLGLESLDNTIKSINSLIKIAEVRSALSKHRLNFIRSSIASLEAKTPSL